MTSTPFSDLRLTRAVGPFVTVSPRGIASGTSTVPNDGAVFGPDNDTTSTSGIQDALNSIASSGGTVFLLSGTYTVGAAIGNTGNKQTVIFQPGVTLEFSGWNSGGIYIGQDTASTTAYYLCAWYGNGALLTGPGNSTPWTLINMNITSSANWPAGQAPYMLVVDGFEITGFENTGWIIAVNNTGTTSPSVFQCVRQLKVSRIYMHNYAGTGGIFIGGSVKHVRFQHVVIDGSETPTTSTSYPFSAVASSGDVAHIECHQCLFVSNGSSTVAANGSSVSLGAGFSPSHLNSDWLFDNCEFFCPSTFISPGMGGTGGLEMDDNEAYVLNIEFEDCYFNNTGITYRGNAAAPPPGFVKFRGGYPQATLGSLPSRSPGQVINVPTTGTGTPLTYQNLDGFDELVIVSGGLGVSITLNGQSVGVTSGVFQVKTGDTLNVTWTSGTGNNPTVNKCPA